MNVHHLYLPYELLCIGAMVLALKVKTCLGVGARCATSLRSASSD